MQLSTSPSTIKIAIIDNHTLFRQGMISLLSDFKEIDTIFDAENGEDMISKLKKSSLPDIILMDITMPVMDGYEATAWLRENHPTVKVLALSMSDEDKPIITMLKNGAVGYMLKESKIRDVVYAMQTIQKHGYYLNELVILLITIVNHYFKNSGLNQGLGWCFSPLKIRSLLYKLIII
jgi:DNA-binding NarL/FixJ family response regulator